MQRLLVSLAALLVAPPVSLAALVLWPNMRDPNVTYMLPSVEQLTGQPACEGSQPDFWVRSQDPVTKDFYGEIFVHDLCPGSPGNPATWNSGCAWIAWDQTGTIMSLTIRWRRQDAGHLPPRITECFTD